MSSPTEIVAWVALIVSILSLLLHVQRFYWDRLPPEKQFAWLIRKGKVDCDLSLVLGSPILKDNSPHFGEYGDITPFEKGLSIKALLYCPILLWNENSFPASFPVMLEIWESSDRWNFRADGKYANLINSSGSGKPRKDNLRWTKYKLTCVDHRTRVGAICILHSPDPNKNDQMLYKLTCVGETIGEGHIVVPA
jgi:hypothetical protein